MSNKQTRRDLIKLASVAAFSPLPDARAHSVASGPVSVRITAGSKRYASAPPLPWRPERSSTTNAIVIDANRTFQNVLGFGAALTDSACYVLHRLPESKRKPLLHDLFHPSQMNLNVCRLCIGASDYAASLYSFDEGAPDPQLKRFSIDHDRTHILPILKAARAENPDLFYFASPWSPPDWMKPSGTMRGGCMHPKSYAPYAEYFLKFLQSYREAGVPVNAVTVQNEVDTEQDGRMPACLWAQEHEIHFVAEHLGPQFAKNNVDTKIWILDHNYNLWGRAICELDDPKLNRYVDGVAWHGYVGHPSAMTHVREAHPDKHMYWTEGGPSINDPHYRTNWAKWGMTFSGVLRNWARCIVGWNLALDEKGKPNIGPFDCGGTITVNSRTGEVTHSGQYWAFAHFSRAVRRGAKRMESSCDLKNLAHVAFAHPDGTNTVVVTNAGAPRRVSVRTGGREAEAYLPGDSLVTLSWKA